MIEVRDLSFGYEPDAPVVRGVSGVARPGRITALIGPNASGKSTLLRCVIGAVAPQSGVAHVDDLPTVDLRGRALAQRLAYVPQRMDLAAAFTVREVVDLGRYALGPSPARTTAALRRLELEPVADRLVPTLSVGQQQRVSLARAVAQLETGAALVLDEPTAAMDLRHARRCMALLRELADEGSPVLVAIHDLSVAATIADDVWLLDPQRSNETGAAPEGSSLVCGPVKDVMEPARLEGVFGVGFEWIDRPDGQRLLLPELQRPSGDVDRRGTPR